MRLSIIVPVLNESANLADLLARLGPLRHEGLEVLLVDGGSTDNTVALAERGGLRVIHSERGRARQMNAGAAHASGEVLLFLHADTQLPAGAPQLVQQALNGSQPCWGRFDVRIAGRPALLKVVAQLMNWRSRWTGIATGDQALFMTRHAFDTVGGFPAQALMRTLKSPAACAAWAPPPACVPKSSPRGGAGKHGACGAPSF